MWFRRFLVHVLVLTLSEAALARWMLVEQFPSAHIAFVVLLSTVATAMVGAALVSAAKKRALAAAIGTGIVGPAIVGLFPAAIDSDGPCLDLHDMRACRAQERSSRSVSPRLEATVRRSTHPGVPDGDRCTVDLGFARAEGVNHCSVSCDVVLRCSRGELRRQAPAGCVVAEGGVRIRSFFVPGGGVDLDTHDGRSRFWSDPSERDGPWLIDLAWEPLP